MLRSAVPPNLPPDGGPFSSSDKLSPCNGGPRSPTGPRRSGFRSGVFFPRTLWCGVSTLPRSLVRNFRGTFLPHRVGYSLVTASGRRVPEKQRRTPWDSHSALAAVVYYSGLSARCQGKVLPASGRIFVQSAQRGVAEGGMEGAEAALAAVSGGSDAGPVRPISRETISSKNPEKGIDKRSKTGYNSHCSVRRVFCFQRTPAPVRNGAVVQLVRTPACHAGGRGFKSLPRRHLKLQPLGCVNALRGEDAAIAQSVERILGKDEVPSSNLGSSSTETLEILGFQAFFVLKS